MNQRNLDHDPDQNHKPPLGWITAMWLALAASLLSISMLMLLDYLLS